MYRQEWVKDIFGRTHLQAVLRCDICNRKLRWCVPSDDGRHICEDCHKKLDTNDSSRSK